MDFAHRWQPRDDYEKQLLKTGFTGGGVCLGDTDGDGRTDVFVGGRVVPRRYPVSPSSRFCRNAGGGLFDSIAMPGLEKIGMVCDALAADIDADGRPDLVLAIEFGTPRILKNQGDWRFDDISSRAGLDGMTGWWHSLEASDIDGDGDPDFAMGNLGLNTKYHPTREKPQLMFFGDFSGAGSQQIVEARMGPNGLLPVRGRSCSSPAMPFLREKFASYHAFASATLEEIDSPERLGESLRLEAAIAASGVLVNEGDGHFVFRELPRMAQISPARVMVFFDANGDGNDDLFIAQNSFSPQRETGRMDGGLGALLLGDGHGSFAWQRPDRSGMVLTGDMSDAAAVDLDGDGSRELVSSLNNGPVAVYRRAGL